MSNKSKWVMKGPDWRRRSQVKEETDEGDSRQPNGHRRKNDTNSSSTFYGTGRTVGIPVSVMQSSGSIQGPRNVPDAKESAHLRSNIVTTKPEGSRTGPQPVVPIQKRTVSSSTTKAPRIREPVVDTSPTVFDHEGRQDHSPDGYLHGMGGESPGYKRVSGEQQDGADPWGDNADFEEEEEEEDKLWERHRKVQSGLQGHPQDSENAQDETRENEDENREERQDIAEERRSVEREDDVIVKDEENCPTTEASSDVIDEDAAGSYRPQSPTLRKDSSQLRSFMQDTTVPSMKKMPPIRRNSLSSSKLDLGPRSTASSSLVYGESADETEVRTQDGVHSPDKESLSLPSAVLSEVPVCEEDHHDPDNDNDLNASPELSSSPPLPSLSTHSSRSTVIRLSEDCPGLAQSDTSSSSLTTALPAQPKEPERDNNQANKDDYNLTSKLSSSPPPPSALTPSSSTTVTRSSSHSSGSAESDTTAASLKTAFSEQPTESEIVNNQDNNINPDPTANLPTSASAASSPTSITTITRLSDRAPVYTPLDTTSTPILIRSPSTESNILASPLQLNPEPIYSQPRSAGSTSDTDPALLHAPKAQLSPASTGTSQRSRNNQNATQSAKTPPPPITIPPLSANASPASWKTEETPPRPQGSQSPLSDFSDDSATQYALNNIALSPSSPLAFNSPSRISDPDAYTTYTRYERPPPASPSASPIPATFPFPEYAPALTSPLHSSGLRGCSPLDTTDLQTHMRYLLFSSILLRAKCQSKLDPIKAVALLRGYCGPLARELGVRELEGRVRYWVRECEGEMGFSVEGFGKGIRRGDVERVGGSLDEMEEGSDADGLNVGRNEELDTDEDVRAEGEEEDGDLERREEEIMAEEGDAESGWEDKMWSLVEAGEEDGNLQDGSTWSEPSSLEVRARDDEQEEASDEGGSLSADSVVYMPADDIPSDGSDTKEKEESEPEPEEEDGSGYRQVVDEGGVTADSRGTEAEVVI